MNVGDGNQGGPAVGTPRCFLVEGRLLLGLTAGAKVAPTEQDVDDAEVAIEADA